MFWCPAGPSTGPGAPAPAPWTGPDLATGFGGTATQPKSSHADVGAIVGGIVGGIAGVTVIGVLLYYLKHRKYEHLSLST